MSIERIDNGYRIPIPMTGSQPDLESARAAFFKEYGTAPFERFVLLPKPGTPHDWRPMERYLFMTKE